MSVRRSLLLSLADSYLGLVLQIASTVILSRILSPADIGVFAIAAVFAALASMFRDFGVAEYLIQEHELTPDKIRAALALNIAASWSMACLLWIGAPFAADFYREAGVGHVMTVQAMSLLIVPFGAVSMAWFRRELNYRPILIANVSSSIVSFLVSTILALRGWGYMSLAWAGLAGIATSVALAVWFRPREFPRWPGLKCLSQVFHFSKFASAIYLIGQAGKGAPELIIGRVRNAEDVGYFSRGYGLVEMFNRLLMKPVMQVCMPYFASSDRQTGAVSPAYIRSVSLLTAAGWPFLAVMAAMAFAAIRLVYGEQWLSAVPLAQVLCLAAAVELVFVMSREALLAKGCASRANTLQIQITALQVLGLGAVVPWGLVGATWGLVLAAMGGLALSQYHLRRGIHLAGTELFRACLPSLALTVFTAGPLTLATQLVPITVGNFIAWAAVSVVVAVPSWLLGLRLLRHPLWDELAAIAGRFRSRPKSAA